MCSPLPEHFSSCTSVRRRGRKHNPVWWRYSPWIFVMAALWGKKKKTLAQCCMIFRIFYSHNRPETSTPGAAKPWWIKVDQLSFLFDHILNAAAQNNSNLHFKLNLNVTCFITAQVEMTFRGWNNVRRVHPKCQIALTLQPLIPKLLGYNFASKFDSHHRTILAFSPSLRNEKCYPFARGGAGCPACERSSLIYLLKRVIGVNVPTTNPTSTPLSVWNATSVPLTHFFLPILLGKWGFACICVSIIIPQLSMTTELCLGMKAIRCCWKPLNESIEWGQSSCRVVMWNYALEVKDERSSSTVWNLPINSCCVVLWLQLCYRSSISCLHSSKRAHAQVIIDALMKLYLKVNTL